MNHAYPISQQIGDSFLGPSPDWYKLTIVGFLVGNPVLLLLVGPFVTGWIILLEFIFTLAMALRCYPLQPGGLIAFEAVLIGMTSPATVIHEVEANFEVILLLIFMVAGVFFLKDLLLFIFTRLLVAIRSKTYLSVTLCAVSALLSAFLDALTVTAVVIGVMAGLYAVYQKVAEKHEMSSSARADDLVQFRAFLRSLVMHAVIGTALGGVTTVVGEPQNLLIATIAGWEFREFFLRMAPVSIPVIVLGLATCALVERFRVFGYGAAIPPTVREVLIDFDRAQTDSKSARATGQLVVQALVVAFLVFGLAFQLAAVGIIGLAVIVLATAFTGITDERRLGRAFEEALPFTALLVVFFAIVAVIHDQHLFAPITGWVLGLPSESQPGVFFLVNGALSMISDNVFVATVYMSEMRAALESGLIDRAQFELLTVAINTGTNLPSIATPNGQAAFLFLLTSSLAPLIQLSYGRMVKMALPYTVVVTVTGFLAVVYLLQ
ncbi:MAG TPA: sodium/proton antiporter NhaB [Gammaproteobacteria bacterium]|nr:sodium/proton antiporter NhaB [Gammaproteobacteria bacterium]